MRDLRPGSRPPRLRPTAALRALLLLALGATAVPACAPAAPGEQAPRSTLFVGVDVSGSFQRGGRYDDALSFAARYIHGHLHGAGGLERPRALFAGAIGGEKPGEPQAFHPIHEFEGKDPAQIEARLREWFPPDDRITDFNAFFRRAATLVKRQNLALAPINLVLLSDGVPDLGPGATDTGRYGGIDLDPLEHLARNVTVRLLYPDPTVAVRWEREVPRGRVRMWTVDATVMRGWRDQLVLETPPSAHPDRRASHPTAFGGPALTGAGTRAVATGANAEAGADPRFAEPPQEARPAAEQPGLWRWIGDNVDSRVRRAMF
ncbi:MAG: hypothetical protein ACLFRX_02660 [Gemmatimonadota bacterium]